MQYYKSNNTNFEKNGDITLQLLSGVLRLELNSGLNEIEFEIPYDKQGRWKKVEEWGVVKQKVFYTKNKQLYRIYEKNKGMFGLRLKARHIFFDLVKHTILDKRAVNLNGQRALERILFETKFKAHSDIDINNTAYFVNLNGIEAINGDNENSFRNRWGGEILNDNFDVYINKKIGRDNGVKIRFGNNLEDINFKIDRDPIITRAYPKAYDGIMLPEKFIDSEHINKYPIICEGFVDVSDLKLKDSENPEDEGFETKEELYEAMRRRIVDLYNNGLDRPKVSGNIKIVNLENTNKYKNFKNLKHIGIGDTITINLTEIGIDAKTRFISTEWDLVTEEHNNMEFGEVEVNYFDKQEIVNGRLDNILNQNGSVKSSELEGIINAMKAPLVAQKDIAKNLDCVAWKCEVNDPNDPNFGYLGAGTKGLMLANSKTPDKREWDYRTVITPDGIIADWLIGKLKTVLIENADGSFAIDLNKPGGAIFRNNGVDAIKIENNMVQLGNWGKNGELIGGLMSLLNNSDPSKPIVALGNALNSATMITYPKEGTITHPSYITFDKFNIMGDKNGVAIRIYEDIDFKNNDLYNAVLSSENNENFIYTNNDKTVIKHGSVFIKLENGGATISGDLTLDGVIKNTSGQVILDPTNPSIGGGDGDWQNGVISSNGFRFMKGYEGLGRYLYYDSGGIATIGYGVTMSEPTVFNKLKANQPVPEEMAAKESYNLKIRDYGKPIIQRCKELGITRQQQFDALCDLAFNAGTGRILANNSLTNAIMRNPNDEAYIRPIWEKFIIKDAAGNILNGLKARRKAECDIYFSGIYEKRPILTINSNGSYGSPVTENNGDGWLPSVTENYKTVNNDYGTGWVIPTTGTITATFPTYPSGGKHDGIDFGTPIGTPVRVSKDGVVIKRRELTTSYGKYLFVDHGGGLITIYAHNSELLVNEGDRVKRGQIIAKTGNTGNSTGPHLHWELRVNGIPQNVAPSLRVGQVIR
ncbi:phage tail spike protein [Clostridium perfringens]|uniref:Lysozyme n=2 Tax=Clostridium perfringens TaxID=1502 RepID=A0AAP6WMM2_CLOPF|nr:phage tail spike protein [Clostridium perfringens]NP_612844.1 peptidase [Clostridium phage phi3626]AAL96785.1 Gp15 protein [Clostridium phage phi3626]EDT22896.1 Gp15 protein [Clostridium perfringens B str. ATCC 3626]NGU30598.1 peptidoglycan DD-metalloendopeptidase family protein [Clostridium perfringens]WEV05011.1 peptidoglycan DD-metalloendopeptidase family protein [Clostridium perfringens B]